MAIFLAAAFGLSAMLPVGLGSGRYNESVEEPSNPSGPAASDDDYIRHPASFNLFERLDKERQFKNLAGGMTIDLADELQDGPVFVSLWSSWCPPCKEELPIIESYALQEGAYAVLGVNVLDQPASALRFADAAGLTFNNIHDESDVLRRALNAPPILPLHFLVEPSGTTTPLAFDKIASVEDLNLKLAGIEPS